MSRSATTAGKAFRYRASTDRGALVEGVVRATSRDAALRELRRQQLWPVVIDPVTATVTARATSVFQLPRSASARRRGVMQWTQTLATLLGAGATLDRALAVAHAQSTDADVATGAGAIRAAVQGGASLAEALQRQPTLFDALHVGVVRAGEAAGSLASSLETLAAHLEDDANLRAQLQSALVYPALMACVASIGVLVLLLFVVPRFATLLSDLGGTLPLSTRALIAVGDLVTRGWWVLVAVTVLAVSGARTVLGSPVWHRRWHATRLAWPLVGTLERSMATARFTRALGLMLGGGMSLLPALRLASGGVSNREIASQLEVVAGHVARGQGLATSLSGVLTPMAVQLIAVGEESGRLDALCLRAATQHDDEVRRSMRSMASLLEPAMILFFGAVVGFVALAMLQAIYAVNAGM